MIVSIDQDCDSSKKSAVVNAISAPPFLVLAEFIDTQNHKILVGAYCAGNVSLNTTDNIYEFLTNTKSFIFSIESDEK